MHLGLNVQRVRVTVEEIDETRAAHGVVDAERRTDGQQQRHNDVDDGVCVV